MPEAVIVSTARSPIGRAFKGLLKDMRLDHLSVRMVQVVPATVPELGPAEMNDRFLGCEQPAGEPAAAWRGQCPRSQAWTACPARR
jgi:acetyl-CoA C-acetyltransferase